MTRLNGLPDLRLNAPSVAASRSDSAPATVVLMMPDLRKDNPYQRLLARSLESQGFHVCFPVGYRRILPFFRAVRENRSSSILHLHWTLPYLRAQSRIIFIIRAVKFLCDLTLVRCSGRPLVWTVHNLVPHESRFPRLELWVRRMLCRAAGAVIVHGSAGKQQAIAKFGCIPEKIAIIPHGHYQDVYSPSPPRQTSRQNLNLPDKTTMLFFGMVRPYKGMPMLLRAWRALAAAEAQLVIAGPCSPEYRHELDMIAPDVAGVIWHDHWIAEEDLPLYFGAADVVVLPFERVQTSGSVMLAITYGKPIITPRLGELPETLAGADDLMYQPGDEAALTKSLRESLSKDLNDIARRTALVAERFDWEPIAQRTALVYRRVIAKSRRESQRTNGRCISRAAVNESLDHES